MIKMIQMDNKGSILSTKIQKGIAKGEFWGSFRIYDINKGMIEFMIDNKSFIQLEDYFKHLKEQQKE